MALSARIQNAVIAGLAALALGMSAFAVWSVGRPHPSLQGGTGVTGTPAAAGDDDAATSSAPPASDVATETAGDSGQETVEPTETAELLDASVGGWVRAWEDEADLLVIGDGYSHLPSQWVQLWAAGLGGQRPVQIHHWGEAADVAFNDPIVLSDTGDAPLTVWSASRAGSTIAAAAQRYDRFVSASTEPDAVLVSLGLSSANEDIPASLDALVAEVDDDVPVLVMVGPEALYQPGVGDAILSWAQDNNDRVAVVDLRIVAPANPTAEQWARAFQQAVEQG